MRITIAAIGRLRAGPEKSLIDDYLNRANRAGKPLGFSSCSVLELDDRKATTMAAQADLLRRAIPKGALVCVMDERGRQMSSPEFARQISGWQDRGCSDLVLMIGGADGLDPSLRNEADFALSFGAMVWPHMLVRVMLSEQIYRAISILGGSPYHRV